MRNYSTITSPQVKPVAILSQVLAALVAGSIIFMALAVAVIVGYGAYNAGQIYPGVSVAGIDLSGMQPEEAAAVLENRISYPSQGRILLKDGEKLWLASPADLGFYLDPQSSARAAYQYGRRGGPIARLANQVTAWYYGASLPPLYLFDERATYEYLQEIANQVNLPTVDASLGIDGIDVVVRPGQVGRSLDMPGTLDLIKSLAQTLRDGEVELVINETPPVILDVTQQAEHARQILSEPLTLVLPEADEDEAGPWKFESDVLASMLTIERVSSPEGERYQVGLEAESLRSFLEGIGPKLARQRENARFIFNDETRQLEVIQPAVTGRALDVDATIESINQKLLAGDHHISLDLEYAEPEVGNDASAEQLGITELVSSQTSYFYGSSPERIQNIQIASARFHGVLVPPGATFSMGEALGDVSLDNGYAEALIIFGNRTIEGVGGGVCQVSTTLFRTVFFGGFPVVERNPHAYRVYYYELQAGGSVDTQLAGLDATVFVPLVDFKFANDTPYWLLMETYVNPAARTLTWKFYSTSDGRQVEWDTSGLRNKEDPPKPLYEENPELEKGEVKQVDWEVEGADVTVTRMVRRNGEVLSEDAFNTHYMPWRAVYEYGPGTKGMPPDEDDKKKRDD
jgi:vancomycin resistance protein YoaR